MLNLSDTTSLIIILSVVVAHWYLSLFFQSFFQHRYASHSQFTMSYKAERIFFILSYLFQGSSYLSPRAYGIMHRLHHAHTDTPEDPHSPQHSTGLMGMMWHTKNSYNAIFNRRETHDEKYSKGLPEWDSLDKMAHKPLSRIMWISFYVGFYVLFATQWWMFLLLPIHILNGPIHGAIVNYFAHKFGYRNFKVNNTSTNLMMWDVIMLGEGLHNNHHKYPSSANFANKWYEFDPLYPVIMVLSKFGVIKMATVKAN